MLLRDIAHSRAGDKGNRSIISVVAYDIQDFPLIESQVTIERVKLLYKDVVKGRVERFIIPQLGALNFVLHDALGGGVTKSLALDAHGNSLSSAILSIEIDQGMKS